MNTFTKALTGTAAAAALAVTSVSPAIARGHDGGGINAGEVIAGALIIGGIAAVASAAGSNNRGYDYGYDRAGYDRGYDRDGRSGYGYRGGNPRSAVEDCVRAAERTASRNSYGRADVTDVRDIDRTRWGYEVRGRIAVNSNGDHRGRDWRDGDGRYGRGWNNDYRGWNSNLRGYDSGSFRCKVEQGRVVDLDFSGIRGL